MKKKIISIILMLCVMAVSLFSFTGCDLYHDNNKKVSEEVVAKVGDEIITKNDLTTWYNYYYYSSGLYYQYTEEQVYELTLNNLVKFKIIINEAKNNDDIVITISDQNHIWEQVFTYLDQTIDSYETEILDRFGIEKEEEEKEEEEEEGTKFEEYKRAEIKYSIDYDQNDTVLKNEYKVPTIEENYYRYLAYQKYLSEITEATNRYSKKEVSSEEAWNQELDRYYKYYEDRLYVQKYNDYCLKNINVSQEAIVNAYINDLNKQSQEFTVYDNYLSTLTSSSNTDLVLYHTEGGAFSVQQIVLEFDDMIDVSHNNSTVKVSEYLSQYLNSGFVFDESSAKTEDQLNYIDIREQYAYGEGGLGENLNMAYIDPETGLTTDENGDEIIKTFADFQSELNDIKTKYSQTLQEIDSNDPEKEEKEDLAERTFVQDFYKLKFSYSKDSGVTDLTSLFNKVGYIFPEHKEDMTTSWVSEFTDAAYKLYDTYKTSNKFEVETFVSNYGIHIMIFAGEMYAGPVAEKNYESLNSTYFSYAVNQTVADYYYDKLLAEIQTTGTNNNAYYLQAMLGSTVSSVLYERVGSILYNEYTVEGKIEIKYPKYEDIL